LSEISIVIRNKNEAKNLESTLCILDKLYRNEFKEVILVDNKSTDNSIEVAKKFKCKIVSIDEFSYGKATNVGIAAASTKYVLLLSSHAIPVGSSFFKNTIVALQDKKSVAGIRYINSFENYLRAIKNDFIVNDPLKYGLMTACAIVNKEVWKEHRFNEDLVFSEDKEWSNRVVQNGYQILDLNETFYYFINRDKKSSLIRLKNETISYYQLHNKRFPSLLVLIGSFFKKIIVSNTKVYLSTLVNDVLVFRMKLKVYNMLNKNGNN